MIQFNFSKYNNSSAGFRIYTLESLNNTYNNYKANLQRIHSEFSEENVHDLRVAIRRFISALDFFSNFYPTYYFKKIKKETKSQFDSLSQLRDIQVMIITTIKMKVSLPQLYEFLIYLIEQEYQQISFNKEKFSLIDVNYLDDYFYFLNRAIRIDYQNTQINFEDVNRIIRSKYIEVLEYKSKVDFDNPQTIHQLRIKIKKFRYMIETIAEVMSKSKRILNILSSFQTKLGLIQDSEVYMKEFTNFVNSNFMEENEKLPVFKYLEEVKNKLFLDLKLNMKMINNLFKLDDF
jgi:CHAD domain-containing protein